jgi:hypothetical protein
MNHVPETIIRDWFTQRFKRTPEQDEFYYNEWWFRIRFFTPQKLAAYMDKQSKELWAKVNNSTVEQIFA